MCEKFTTSRLRAFVVQPAPAEHPNAFSKNPKPPAANPSPLASSATSSDQTHVRPHPAKTFHAKSPHYPATGSTVANHDNPPPRPLSPEGSKPAANER